MAEAPSNSKRLTETPNFEESNSKRHKPYNTILSLLDEEEETLDQQNHDLSVIFTTLEQELSLDFDSPPPATEAAEEDDGVKSIMRHLLEASDDELGIPNYSSEEFNTNNDDDFGIIKSEENSISVNFFDNGLWEFDDVAADYYTIMQSELFM
ncbi:hypothetical protein SASPL_142703 [Salvia splendens]|uniref:Uncharacterized protein n=1 Tax=Salvia splendens TaxID=180675 RepID=A0A8X8Z915_SALSN|nr:uncharacterized protein LOC121770145 [Salvia splendens]KAG6396552.1 hypothetical protein SASPL_142703 [Salvia splendens]